MENQIHLSETERFLVRLIKLHYPELTSNFKGWNGVLVNVFSHIYGYKFQETSFADNFHIFQKLFDIFNKISENRHQQTLNILKSCLNPRVTGDGLAMQTAITEICGYIQVTVVEGRFSLDLSKEQTTKLVKQYEKLFQG